MKKKISQLSYSKRNNIIENNNVILSPFQLLYSKNKNYNINNINKDNNNNISINSNLSYTLKNDIFKHINKRRKRNIKKDSIFSFKTTYDIGESLSNIKKQLNNISINEKNILKIKKEKKSDSKTKYNKYNLSEATKNNKLKSIIKKFKYQYSIKNALLKSNQISFSIPASNNEKEELIIKNKDLVKENNLLRENIKFLLSQIKSFKKTNDSKDSLKDNIKDSIKDNINELITKYINPKKTNNNNSNNNNSEQKIPEYKNKNKINNVFDILNKYKNEICNLKQKMKKLNNENDKLKEYFNENSKIKNDKYNTMENTMPLNDIESINKKKLFEKKSIINTIKKIPLNNRNKRANLIPYTRKNFTYTSLKTNSFNSNITVNNEFNKKYSRNTFQKNYLYNNNLLNNTSKNLNNMMNSISSKGKHVILIDSDFTGEEKMENQTYYLSCENRANNLKSLYLDKNIYNN